MQKLKNNEPRPILTCSFFKKYACIYQNGSTMGSYFAYEQHGVEYLQRKSSKRPLVFFVVPRFDGD